MSEREESEEEEALDPLGEDPPDGQVPEIDEATAAWLHQAGLAYSIAMSAAWLLLAGSLVFGLLSLGPAELSNPYLPWPLQHAGILFAALAVAGCVLMWLVRAVARRHGIPRYDPLIFAPLAWLVAMEARLDATISQSSGVRWRPRPGEERDEPPRE